MHPAHRHRIVRDDQVARVCLSAHPIEQVAEAVDVCVVERRVDLVEHADGRGIGQEESEDESYRGERLFAARKQGECGKTLTRRLGHAAADDGCNG